MKNKDERTRITNQTNLFIFLNGSMYLLGALGFLINVFIAQIVFQLSVVIIALMLEITNKRMNTRKLDENPKNKHITILFAQALFLFGFLVAFIILII